MVTPRADDPADDQPESPTLTVLWRGNRVLVFADGSLGRGITRSAQQQHHVIGDIASAINGSGSVDAMITTLRSTVGDTHDVDVRVVAGALQIRLLQRG